MFEDEKNVLLPVARVCLRSSFGVCDEISGRQIMVIHLVGENEAIRDRGMYMYL